MADIIDFESLKKDTRLSPNLTTVMIKMAALRREVDKVHKMDREDWLTACMMMTIQHAHASGITKDGDQFGRLAKLCWENTPMEFFEAIEKL